MSLPWRIVITRSLAQAQPLAARLAAEGFKSSILPLLEITALKVPAATLAKWLSMVEELDYLFISSINAWEHLPAPLREVLQGRGSQKIITMGYATTQGCVADKVPVFYTPPPGSTSESILREDFLQAPALTHKKIVLLAGEGGRSVLAETLAARGATVHWWRVYRQELPKLDLTPHLVAWQQENICFIISSNNGLSNLFTLAPKAWHPWLRRQCYVVISQRTQDFARTFNCTQVFCARSLAEEDLLHCLHQHVKV